jgi:hypothetical protein
MYTHTEAFFFGNLGYARLNTTFYSHIDSPAMNPFAKLLHALQVAFTDPGNAVVALLAAYGLGYRMWRLRAWKGTYGNELFLILGLLPVLLIGCWGPTPTQYQYYYMLFPFLVLGILYTMASESAEYLENKQFRTTLIAALLAVGLTGLPRWYWSIVYLPTPERWVPVQVHRTSQWIRENTPSNGPVLTLDTLIPCESGQEIYPDYAVGRFMWHVGPYLSPELRHRHHVSWGKELDDLLVKRPPEAVLIDARIMGMVPEFVDYAHTHGFREIPSHDRQLQLLVRPKLSEEP